MENENMVCEECHLESFGYYGKSSDYYKRPLCETHKFIGGFCGCGDHYTDCNNCYGDFNLIDIQRFAELEQRNPVEQPPNA